uniref:FERM domain containing 3 n=1 Tax=Maylandia zebra TaxID=106582 RepID=A0A3P9B8N2_9CICH
MMELLGHRNSSDVGGSLVQGSLELGDGPGVDNTQNYGSKIGGLELDMTPERLREEGMKQREVGALEVFHPGEAEDEQDSSIVVAEALRCQVKITTRRSLHLRIANHTRRDVYVRLVGNGGRIAGFSTGPQRNILEESVAAVKDSVPLSPLKSSAGSADAEQQSTEAGNSASGNDLQPRVSMETSNLRPQTPKAEHELEEDDEASGTLTISELTYSPCASMLPTPVDDSQGGVDLLFSSPVQSPARLLRELHADPDIQAQLEAERERDRAYERTRLAARSRMSGVLTSSLRLLSSNDRVNACVLSVARFVAVVMGVLLVTVPTLLLLLESDIDVSFLHEIRQTPEFEQFHYEYYCPLRRWILCKISMAMENLWSD